MIINFLNIRNHLPEWMRKFAGMKYLNTASAGNVMRYCLIDRMMKKTVLGCTPISLMIEPTAACNLQCPKCPRTNIASEYVKNVGFLTKEIFKTVHPFIKKAHTISLSGFGECFLHPDYLFFLSEIRRLNPRGYVTSVSNAHLITEEILVGLITNYLNLLIISLDGISDETNNITRDGSVSLIFEKLELIKKIKTARNSVLPKISIDFGVNRVNISELPKLVEMAPALGIDCIELILTDYLKGAEIDADILMEEKEVKNHPDYLDAMNRAKRKNVSLILHEPKTCMFMFEMLFINWDGKIQYCYKERETIGNVKETSLEAIWNNVSIQKVRRLFYEGGNKLSCSDCMMHNSFFLKTESKLPVSSRFNVLR